MIERGPFAPRVGGRPSLQVEASRLVYRYPALLKDAVSVDRATVHSVWLQPFPYVREDGRSVRERLTSSDLSARAAPWPVDHRLAPDLGGVPLWKSRNLLVVFTEPLAFAGKVRPWRTFLGHMFSGGRGRDIPTYPSNGTVAHAWWASIPDESAARMAFAGWPTSDSIPPDVMPWVSGEAKPD